MALCVDLRAAYVPVSVSSRSRHSTLDLGSGHGRIDRIPVHDRGHPAVRWPAASAILSIEIPASLMTETAVCPQCVDTVIARDPRLTGQAPERPAEVRRIYRRAGLHG